MLGQILRELPDTQVTLLLRGDAQQRLENEILNERPVRGPRRQPREDDQRRPRPRGPGRRQRDRHRHPLRRVRLLRAVARRGAGAQRARARRACCSPCATPAATRTSSTSPRPTPRACAPGSCSRSRRAPRRPSPGWTSTPSSTPRRPGATTSRPSRGCRSTSTGSSPRPHRAIGPAGGPAVGTRAEILRYEWVREQLTERGRERARALGWSDTYGLSQGARRAHAARREPEAAHDRPPGDRRVRAEHAVPGLDGVAEGRRPDHARLRRRHHPRPLRRQPQHPDRHHPRRLRGQRVPRRRRAPARTRCACSTSRRACATRSRSATWRT